MNNSTELPTFLDLDKSEMSSNNLSECHLSVNLTEDAKVIVTMNTILIDVLQPILVVFGIIGNIINITVLTRRWMYSSTNCYLTALAIYDMMYLIVVPTLSLEDTAAFKNIIGIDYYRYAGYARPISDIFSNTAVWLTVVFTVERYIAVSHPMRGHVLCTPQRARWVIFITCLLVFLLLLPEFFEYTTSTDPCLKHSLAYTEFGKLASYRMGYNWGVVVLIFTIVPLLLVSIFNMFLVNSVWRASQMRRELSNTNSLEDRKNKDQQRITIMLIAVVVVFFCLHTPNAVALLYYTYNTTVSDSWLASHYNQLVKLFKSVNFLALINSTINFVLYSSLSTKYRRTFKKVFLPCCVKAGAYHFTMTSIPRKKLPSRANALRLNTEQESQLLYRNGQSKPWKNGSKHAREKNGNVGKLTDSDSSTQEFSVTFVSSV